VSRDFEIDLLVGFVNTRDLDEDTDAIGDVGGLAGWAREAGLGGLRGHVSDSDHRRLLELREALRALLRTNNGGSASDVELAPLRAAAQRASFGAAVGAGGTLDLEPRGAGAEAIEARLLLAIERLQALGAWERLKACPAEDCEWAFFDSSRNRSRTWCSMEVCGNRTKTRRYRSRRASG
jgi:predicted RNA-binding Zn ribbon-like protein